MVSSNGWPSVSGSRRATKPATEARTPKTTEGRGAQISAYNRNSDGWRAEEEGGN